jgi:hypothetical protein
MPPPTRLIAFLYLLSVLLLAFAWSSDAVLTDGCKKCLETYRDGNKEKVEKGCGGKRYLVTAKHAQKAVS